MRILLYVALLAEIGGVGYWYAVSPHGYAAYEEMRRAHDQMQADLAEMAHEVARIDTAYTAWAQDPFWYEQYARTQLQMGYPDEIVYLLQS